VKEKLDEEQQHTKSMQQKIISTKIKQQEELFREAEEIKAKKAEEENLKRIQFEIEQREDIKLRQKNELLA
jgi:hypothetical protein